jgi:hypothetical protein
MLPALVLVGIGHRRRFWLPLPAFLLWPLWLAGWVVWLPLKVFGAQWAKTVRVALQVGLHLSGTRIDIDTSDGGHIHVRMI